MAKRKKAAAKRKPAPARKAAAPKRAADARLWPIDDADVGFARGRPYVCAHIFIGALSEGGERITQYLIYPEERAIREPA